jgi:hypothetical protein
MSAKEFSTALAPASQTSLPSRPPGPGDYELANRGELMMESCTAELLELPELNGVERG